MASILLIEPDVVLGEVYRAALETAGHKVIWLKQAEAAVHTADERKPDLVIVELQLRGHNGVEFLYEFRSYGDWQDVPLLLHTVAQLEPNPKLWQQLGITGYLYKPQTSLERLIAHVEEALLNVKADSTASQLSAGQGDGEGQTEAYNKYDEGALEPTTPSSAGSARGVTSSARKQSGAMRKR